eukprot:gb/GECG01003174.1/.p1 GENE.gb/GECG01003174.1/~~gb/GECG01003174.1/.p1  ORF type:complete len:100 (+),score=19.21 gb/GECG01003174.1/:1-300(+)
MQHEIRNWPAFHDTLTFRKQINEAKSELETKRKQELKEVCYFRGLNTGGNKLNLIERLKGNCDVTAEEAAEAGQPNQPTHDPINEQTGIEWNDSINEDE